MNHAHVLFTVMTVLASTSLACSSSAPSERTQSTTSQRIQVGGGDQWTVYDDPYGNGTANPLAGVSGNVDVLTVTDQDAQDWGGTPSTEVMMNVMGLPANTNFPAHVHVKPCAPPDKGGGHYQNVPGGPADATNEVHLDFSSDPGGFAWVDDTAPFAVRSGEAHSIVIHDATPDAAGKLPKLACVDVAF